jgi:hypothetical protein
MKSAYQICIALIITVLLLGCGGGDEEVPCPPNTPCDLLEQPAPGSKLGISLTLTDVAGNATQAITSTAPGKLTATVTGTVQPSIVTFSSTIGDLPIKTAVTDANGKASVDIFAGNTLGAGTVTAKLASGEQAQTILVVGATDVRMGSGAPFVSGVVAVSIAQISAGGTASVSVTLQDSAGNLFTEPVAVNFTSTCSGGPTPLASLSSPVNSVNGVATSTYLAKGCVGVDAINVTANVGGKSLSASGSINVLPASVGSLEFVSATPALIGLKGTGLVEASTVVFRVLDTDGKAVANKTVDFALNTDMGGITLSVPQAVSDAQGLVRTVVNAGTTSTTVRVTASTGTNPVITSQSSRLVLSTGIAEQDSFTAAPEVLNPECWDFVGDEVPVLARLADAFNNPPPDGTAVYFTTEGGAIDASCLTVSGSCTVNFYCQHPIPTNGRSSVLATAIGEESFRDTNGNGRFDAAEIPFWTTDVEGRSFDLDEAFVDYDENGAYDQGLDVLIDFNSNGVWDARDGKYNGVLCAIAPAPLNPVCADRAAGEPWSINIREDFVMVMAGSRGFASNIIVVDSSADNGDGVLDLYGEQAGQAFLTLADVNNQQMPFGTKVTFSSSVGAIITQNSFTWPSSNTPGGMRFGVAVKGEVTPKSGTLVVETLTPHGVSTTVAVIPIVIH